MEGLIDAMEGGLDKIGLMGSPDGIVPPNAAPLARAALGGGVGYFVITTWQPLWAYDTNGNALEWRFTSKKDPSLTTLVPYWLAALVPAFALGVLI